MTVVRLHKIFAKEIGRDGDRVEYEISTDTAENLECLASIIELHTSVLDILARSFETIQARLLALEAKLETKQ